MATQKDIKNPRVTRYNITETTDNNNSGEILRDYLFGEGAANFSLSATDPIDSGAITGASIISMSMAVSETIDSAAFGADAIISIILSQTEQIDTADFEGDVVIEASADMTDNIDTALIEIVDATPRNFSVNATEGTDRSNIRASATRRPVTDHYRGGSSVFIRIPPIYPDKKKSDAKISVIEQGDSSRFSAVLLPVIQGKMSISEKGDSAHIDEYGFHDERKAQDEIMLLTMVA